VEEETAPASLFGGGTSVAPALFSLGAAVPTTPATVTRGPLTGGPVFGSGSGTPPFSFGAGGGGFAALASPGNNKPYMATRAPPRSSE